MTYRQTEEQKDRISTCRLDPSGRRGQVKREREIWKFFSPVWDEREKFEEEKGILFTQVSGEEREIEGKNLHFWKYLGYLFGKTAIPSCKFSWMTLSTSCDIIWWPGTVWWHDCTRAPGRQRNYCKIEKWKGTYILSILSWMVWSAGAGLDIIWCSGTIW